MEGASLSTLTRDVPGPTDPPAQRPTRPPPPRTPSARSPWRLPAFAALLLAIGLVAYLVTRSSSYHYRFDFVDAGQLVTGDLVRIGGTSAGTIDSISLTPNGLAQVGVSLDSSFGPLRQGTTATIRSAGLTGVASRYIDVSPAPSFRPPLAPNAVLPTSNTSGIVDIDSVFAALDAKTRQGLRRLIRGFAAWYRGKGAQANLTTHYFPPALRAYARLFTQIDADTPTLDQFITETGRALGAIDQRSPQLSDLISQARVTAQALASDNQSLSQALVNLPGALKNGSATFLRLRTTTLPALSRLVNATRPVTAPLTGFLPRLNPVLTEAVPTFALLKRTFDTPGPNNDAYDALRDLPRLADETTSDFPRAIKALGQATPIFEFARPYIPDLVGWVVNWDGIFAPYDANGHYARTTPVLGAFNFADDGQGGVLTQVPPNLRGSGGALRTGFLRRCPGAAIVPPPDRSAPFVDSGPLSNPHCAPSETIGGSP
jgi:phospholipid/cholesterol/gamma-HCH transport system substrate-binding protein